MSTPHPTQSTPQRSGAPAAEFNPLLWVHHLLRGRYHWAILLAAALAAGAGYLEYQRVELLYRTTGEIRLRPYIPRLLESTEITGRMRNFDNFVDDQVRLLRGDRVTAMAMDSDPWRALERPHTEAVERAFEDALSVRGSHDSGLIRISFEDPEREATAAAVQGVIESYQRLFDETDPTLNRRRMQLLDERRLNLSNQLSSLRSQIRGFGDVFGPDGVRFRHQQASSRVRELDSALEETEMAITELEQRIEEGPPPMTVEQIAEHNPRVAELRETIQGRQRSMAMAEERGLDRAVETHREELARLERRIEEEVAAFDHATGRDAWLSEQQSMLDELETRRATLTQRRGEAQARLQQVGEERRRLEELEAEASETQAKLDRVEREIESLNVESAMGDRLEVLNYGRTRNEPINADEPAHRAMIGAVAGGGLGVGVVMLIGLLNPTLRRSDDLSAAQGEPKLLGLLPHLGDGSAAVAAEDREDTALASQCIHQIRMFLQLEGRNEDVRSFVISGPVSGTGKTSLTMALGFSYAAAGARTLLVDFDLLGTGLTRRLDVGRQKRLGRLLQERGLVSAADVARVAAEDPSGDKRLGQKLVDQHLIDRADIDKVLEAQAQSRVGLLDVLAGEPLEQCVIELPTENLSLLSAGNATPEQISQVGRLTVQQFLKKVHAMYDVILIDTGPVPGSIEASVVAAEADRVVLTVSRGNHLRKLNSSIAFLGSIGARIAGLIYNRADPRDMARSVHGYSTSHSTRRSEPGAAGNGHSKVAAVAGNGHTERKG